MFHHQIMLHRLPGDMIKRVTSSWVSPSSMICPFVTFQHWSIGLLTVPMLPIVGAVPSSWSIPVNDTFKRDESMNTSATWTSSSTSLPTSSTSNPKSDSASDTQLVLLISSEFAYGLIIGKSFLAGVAHERKRLHK